MIRWAIPPHLITEADVDGQDENGWWIKNHKPIPNQIQIQIQIQIHHVIVLTVIEAERLRPKH